MKYLYNILFVACFVILHTTLFAQVPGENLNSNFPVARSREMVDEIIHKNIFIKTVASKNVAFTGEPVLLTYKLYMALNGKSDWSRQPTFDGCSIVELPHDEETFETINGKTFHVYNIRKVEIIPLQEGVVTPGVATMQSVVSMINKDGNGIDNFSATISSEPVSITVKPLPVAGRPNNFSGIVGNFGISATLDSNTVPAGDNVLLRVTINGVGDFTGIRLPAIAWPKNLEHFEATDTQHTSVFAFPVTGYKTFEVPFIGDKEGSAEIPPISFSFFDPDAQQYKTVQTNTIPVHFTKAVNTKDKLAFLNNEGTSNNKYLWIVAGIAITVILFFIINSRLKEKKAKAVLAKREMENLATIIPQEPEHAAQNADEVFTALNELGSLHDVRAFLSSSSNFLTQTLRSRLHSANLTEGELIELMQHDKTYSEIAYTCTNIYTLCNKNLYSPDTEEDIKEKIYFDLTAVVKKLYAAN